MGSLKAVYLSGLILLLASAALAAPENLRLRPVPAEPEVQATGASVKLPDGGERKVKGPYLAVQLECANTSESDSFTISNVAFTFSGSFEEEGDRYFFTLKPALKIAPGATQTTEVFYLEGLALPKGVRQHVSISVTGWKNTGSDPGDQFAKGTSFKTQK